LLHSLSCVHPAVAAAICQLVVLILCHQSRCGTRMVAPLAGSISLARFIYLSICCWPRFLASGNGLRLPVPGSSPAIWPTPYCFVLPPFSHFPCGDLWSAPRLHHRRCHDPTSEQRRVISCRANRPVPSYSGLDMRP
jgi:hypothetical protein